MYIVFLSTVCLMQRILCPFQPVPQAEIQRQYRTVSAICIDRSSYMTRIASITLTVKEGVKVSAPIPFDSVLVSFMRVTTVELKLGKSSILIRGIIR